MKTFKSQDGFYDRDEKLRKVAMRLFTAAFFLTVSIFGLVLWQCLSLYKNHFTELSEISQIERLAGEILQYDEVLTMSARMAAATGKTTWEDRYNKFEPKLDHTIKTVISLTNDKATHQAIEDTDKANLALVKMEKEAFKLVRAGNQKRAQVILYSPKYNKQKIVYAEGIQGVHKRLYEISQAKMASTNKKLIYFIIASLLLLFLLVIIWVFVRRSFQNWREFITGINEELDKKVKLGTKELKEVSQAVEVQRAKLLASSKLSKVGEMAAGVAHEINNPLTIINLYLNDLNDDLTSNRIDKKKSFETLKKIKFAVARISEIIKGLKTASRDSSKDPYKPVSVNSLVNGAISLCREMVINQTVQLDLGEIPENIFVNCRASEITQVLLNLFSNAFHAVEDLPQKWIQVVVKDEGSMVHIFVKDSGSGIPKEIEDKILEPFFTTKASGKGTGLGLSISKAIAERHGGSLSVDQHHGPNTCFVLKLKKLQAHDSQQKPLSSPANKL